MAAASHQHFSISNKRSRRSPNDYTIALFCVLDVELAALRGMLDDIHEDIPVNHGASNVYILGELSKHNVVIAVLPVTGNNHSGTVAARIRDDFPSIRFGLLVGVGGGVPGQDGKNDIRLGDVIVSEASSTADAVVQFDRGKHHSSDHFELTGHLNKPSHFLSALVKKLKAQHLQEQSEIPSFITDMLRRNPEMKNAYGRPGADQDQLFDSTYEHNGGHNCEECCKGRLVKRHSRDACQPQVHYGTIGTSNCVVRSAVERDRLGKEYNILCVEMEAAGLVDQLGCLVVRGICDYADSHKSKTWQPYAAAVAAAYAKDLLCQFLSGGKSSSATTFDKLHCSTEHIPHIGIPAEDASSHSSEEKRFKTLHTSLAFQRMDARLRNVSPALSQTCGWLAKHDSFLEWNDTKQRDVHYGFLWIKGKPGSGKSTLMKALLGWENKKNRQQDVLSYFFNARASGQLEKSSEGLYRSLVHQIVLVCPAVRTLFLEQFACKEAGGVVENWTIDELKPFLIDVVMHHLFRPLVILVDALDEGDERDVRQLVAFLEELADVAHSSEHSLRICLSSRHYPNITIKNGVSLILEDQQGHDEDIRRYIHHKLVDDKSADMAQLRHEIWLKSAGVFFWVVLVIPILNEAFDHGHHLHAANLSGYLKDLPPELDDLFGYILERNKEDLDDCLTTLQWVLFSEEVLSPTQLYIAVGVTSTSTKFNSSDFRPERIHRCLLDASRGLTEISKGGNPAVQFIHETAREFLRDRGLAQIAPRLVGNIEGGSHEKLKTCCSKYVQECTMEVVDNRDRDEYEYREKEKVLQSRYPFLKYAATYIFQHADIAEGLGNVQGEWLKQFDDNTATLEKWICIRNSFEWAKKRRHTLGAPLLYLLAEMGLSNLVRLLSDTQRCDGLSQERYGTALQAACAEGHEMAARLIIKNNPDVNVEGGEYGRALRAATYMGRKNIVKLLLDAGADVNARGRLYGPALQAASDRGNENIVRLLLNAGADVNARGGLYGPALQVASDKNNENIVRLLLNAGANVNAQKGYYGTSLQAASLGGHENIVRLLLDAGADVNARGGHYGGALQAALFMGYENIVRLLLDAGADVNAQRGSSESPLAAALMRVQTDNPKRIVALLRERGAVE